MAQPAGDAGRSASTRSGLHEEEARALEAHQPLVAAAGEVVDVARAHVDRHDAARPARRRRRARRRARGRGAAISGERHPQAGLELRPRSPRRGARRRARARRRGARAPRRSSARSRRAGAHDLEPEELGRPLPRRHVGRELAVEEDRPRRPDSQGKQSATSMTPRVVLGVKREVLGARADERGELSRRRLRCSGHGGKRGGAAARVVVERPRARRRAPASDGGEMAAWAR